MGMKTADRAVLIWMSADLSENMPNLCLPWGKVPVVCASFKVFKAGYLKYGITELDGSSYMLCLGKS